MRKSSLILLLLSSFLILASCEDTPLKSLETENLRTNKTGVIELNVDHYMQVAYGPFPGLFHLTQQGEQIENHHWQIQYDPITNFDYEWGYRYRLLVNKQKFEPQALDGPAYEYEVIEVLSKKKVDDNEQFRITLKQYFDDGGAVVFLKGDAENGFSIFAKDFECRKFCDKLAQIEKIDKTLVGIFEYESGEEIILEELESP